MALEEQMEMNFGTRGVDPVSGNDVPVGSLPEEVRDDIPAQLSEGEYVVPADVVRYYGVKFFEDLRTAAKMGFDEMDANGRIGGDPIEVSEADIDLSMDDLEVVQGMDEGGDVKPKFKNRAEMIMYYLQQLFAEEEEKKKPKKKGKSIAEQINFGGKYDEGGLGGFGDLPDMFAEGSAVEVRMYKNDAGHILYITFINGEPQMDIPDGYYPVGGGVPVDTTETPAEQPSSGGGGGGGSAAPAPQPIDYKNLSVDELADMVQEQQSMKGDVIAGGMGLINPILGGVVKFAMYSQAKQTVAELERRLEEPNLPIYEKEYLENLLEIAQRDKPSLIQRLFGTKEEAAKQGVPLEEMEGIEMTGTGELPEVTVTELPGLDGKPYSPDVKADEAMSTQEIEDMANKAIDTSTQPYVSQPFTPVTGADNEPNAPYGGGMETILNDGRSPIGSAADTSKRVSSVPQSSRDAASKALVGYDDRTKNKIDDARRNLATNDELKAMQDAADRTKQTLKNLERGVVTGFAEGGDTKKRKTRKKKSK